VLAKRFKCPFCANDKAVECEMKHKIGVGNLRCRICDASFQMPIHHLSEPVDIFSEWLDACEAAERGETTGAGGDEGSNDGEIGTTSIQRTGFLDDSDEDDDLGQASGIGSRKTAAVSNGGGEKESVVNDKPSYTSLGLDDSDDDSE